ncbi:hypothetical protein ACXYSU_24250, partial [Escherichia coli]
TGGTADRNRSHWSTSKTPSYTKSVSWQHHRDCKDIKGEEEKKEGCVKHRERSSEVHFLY